ncbi:MAG: hypothetical protein ACFE9S_16480 [Candidatus Hermodarchaeota archaeon]
MSYQQNPILTRVIDDLIGRYSDNIIAIYGIGSFFDDTLPPNWVKNDIDIIVFVKTLESIPKQDWTEVRYKKRVIDEHQVWIGFNTIQAYQDRYSFSKESYSNYEWSLIELSYPENSKLIYGKDIRDQLPSVENLEFDYDDILARGLYHLDKSIKEQESTEAKKKLSKAIFKIAFYFCLFFDPQFRRTSIIEIGNNLRTLEKINKNSKKILEFFEEALVFRITEQYKSDFIKLREELIRFIFGMLENGSLHKKMIYQDMVKFLTNTYSGFPEINNILKKFFNDQIKKSK